MKRQQRQALETIARQLVARGKGILAADSDRISGMILYDETIRHVASDGLPSQSCSVRAG